MVVFTEELHETGGDFLLSGGEPYKEKELNIMHVSGNAAVSEF